MKKNTKNKNTPQKYVQPTTDVGNPEFTKEQLKLFLPYYRKT